MCGTRMVCPATAKFRTEAIRQHGNLRNVRSSCRDATEAKTAAMMAITRKTHAYRSIFSSPSGADNAIRFLNTAVQNAP
jgi:hypothetical protein